MPQEANPNEIKSNRFQRQFDILLICLLAGGLFLTLLYGAAAGTCPPDPQQLSASAAAAGQAKGTGGRTVGNETTGNTSAASTAAGNVAAGNTAEINTAETNSVETNTTEGAVQANATAEPPAPAPRASTQRRPCVQENSSGFVGALLALAIALASLAVGVFIGFLFGLPRTLTSSEVRVASAQAAGQAAAQNAEGGQAADGTDSSAPAGTGIGSGSDVNTNLEKISDWLTTIIVGVGLTKLQEIPGGLESFGEQVGLYFGYGGKVFGIAGGLFFLIVGFFLAYVGTRVKLSLVFVWSQRINQGAAVADPSFRRAAAASAVASQAQSPELKKADEDVLTRNLADLKTPEERAAYANAAARSGKNELAADILEGVAKERPNDAGIMSDYAGVLARLGREDQAQDVLATIRTTAPAAESEVQDKVYIGRLQGGLYKSQFEDSIAAGEELLKRPISETNAWIHIWLACAYGQKHRSLKAGKAPAAQIEEVRVQVLREVTRAVTIEPSLKAFIATLYDPAKVIGSDNDLTSLHPDDKMDEVLSLTSPAPR